MAVLVESHVDVMNCWCFVVVCLVTVVSRVVVVLEVVWGKAV